MAYNIASAFNKLLVWCLIVVALSNGIREAEAIFEAFGGCKRYCHDDLHVSSYDCFFFCIYRCTPSIGGGCDDYDTSGGMNAFSWIPSKFPETSNFFFLSHFRIGLISV